MGAPNVTPERVKARLKLHNLAYNRINDYNRAQVSATKAVLKENVQ